MRSTTFADQTLFIFDRAQGPSIAIAATLGAAVRENVILGGEVWGTFVDSPSLTFKGESGPEQRAIRHGDLRHRAQSHAICDARERVHQRNAVVDGLDPGESSQ